MFFLDQSFDTSAAGAESQNFKTLNINTEDLKGLAQVKNKETERILLPKIDGVRETSHTVMSIDKKDKFKHCKNSPNAKSMFEAKRMSKNST